MNIAPQFTGEIKDGKLTIRNRQQFNEWIKSLKGEVRIIVERVKGKRSNLQNNYYWLFLNIISLETGNEANDLHRIFKAKFLPRKSIKYGKQIYKIPISTTSLSKIEFGEYMNRISAEAGEYGITLPNTEDYYKKN